MNNSLFLIHLLHFSTCFKQCCVHLQEVKLFTAASGFITVIRYLTSAQAVRPYVRKEQLVSHCMNVYYHEIWQLRIFWKYVKKIQVSLNSDSHSGNLHVYLCTFMLISRSNVLWVGNISTAMCRETQNNHFMFNDLFRKSCRLWDNMEKYHKTRQATGDSSIRPIHIACRTDTHSEYVIIIAFLQEWIHESPSIFRHTYIACLYLVHIRALISLFYLQIPLLH
jgi:hypothetical protein